MHRFFINSDSVDGDRVTITGADVHHIRDVLRLGPGNLVICQDGSAVYRTEITEILKSEIRGRIVETETVAVPGIKVTLFQGMPKGSKLDEIVEKTTELGVDRIVPVIMEHTIGRRGPEKPGRTERRLRIAKSAAEQSRRPDIPRVDPPMAWERFVEEISGFDLAVVFWEDASDPVKAALDEFGGEKLAIAIGPEGGLSEREVEALVAAGARTAWLGPRVLRTETAAVAALAIVNYALGR